MSTKTLGVLKTYSPAKCFGFISPSNGDPDVFLPLSELQRAGIHGIEAGQYLTFEIAQFNKGPRQMACKVALAAAPAADKRMVL